MKSKFFRVKFEDRDQLLIYSDIEVMGSKAIVRRCWVPSVNSIYKDKEVDLETMVVGQGLTFVGSKLKSETILEIYEINDEEDLRGLVK